MRFPFFCWLAILALGTVDGVTAAPPAREPVAVAYLSSVDGVLDDIDYVVTAGDQPQLSQVVKGVIANLNNLEGIDRTQPIGLYAFLPSDLGGGQKDPDIVGFIPVTDVEALKKTAHLSNVLSLESTDKPNRYEFKTPEKTLSVFVDQGHAFITEKAELLDQPLPAPASVTQMLAGQYDLVVQLRKEGVPKLLWDFGLIAALSASDKELKKLRGSRESDDLLKVQALEVGRKSVVALMGEAKSAWIGVRVSREDRNAVVDAKLEFTEGGKVAQALASMAEQQSSLVTTSIEDAPAGVHFHVALPEEVRKLSSEAGRLIREKKDQPTESIPEPQRTSVNVLIDVLQQTIDGGVYELVVQFAGEPQTGMTMVAGLHIADGTRVSDAVSQLLPEAAKSDKVSQVVPDAGESRNIHFARIDLKEDSEDIEDKVELFYGGKPSLYLGAEATTLWFLVGDEDALQDFASLAETAQRQPDRALAASFSQAHLHLSDWLGLLSLAGDQGTQDFTAAARIAVKDPDRDAIRMNVRPVSDGVQMTMTLDEAFLNLIGAAIGKE